MTKRDARDWLSAFAEREPEIFSRVKEFLGLDSISLRLDVAALRAAVEVAIEREAIEHE